MQYSVGHPARPYKRLQSALQGCWAAEYGYKQNLSFDDIDSIVTQGKELGTHIYIYTGGEPLVRKHDLIEDL